MNEIRFTTDSGVFVFDLKDIAEILPIDTDSLEIVTVYGRIYYSDRITPSPKYKCSDTNHDLPTAG